MSHAIVAAISRYPGWPDRDLDGPLNDLVDFGRWLLDPHGGQIDPASAPEFAQWLNDPGAPGAPTSAGADRAVQFFVTPNPALPMGLLDASPLTVQVEDALRRMNRRGRAALAAGGDPRVGERLYLYFAGHGFSPDRRETALLMADASADEPGLHIVGRAYADHFVDSNIFDEVVLIMDCCREDNQTIPVRVPPFQRFMGPRRPPNPARPFCALASSWDQQSREEVLPDGRKRGVFTRLLVEGLRGAARDGEIVSPRSLERWVVDRVNARNDDGPRQVPDFDYDDGAEMTLSRPPPEPANLRLRVTGDGLGDVVVEGGPKPGAKVAVRRDGPSWEYALEPGIYVASVVGTTRQLIIRETMLGGPIVDI